MDSTPSALSYTDDSYYPKGESEKRSRRDRDRLPPDHRVFYAVELPTDTELKVTLTATGPVEMALCNAAEAVLVNPNAPALKSTLSFQTNGTREIVLVRLNNPSSATVRSNLRIVTSPCVERIQHRAPHKARTMRKAAAS